MTIQIMITVPQDNPAEDRLARKLMELWNDQSNWKINVHEDTQSKTYEFKEYLAYIGDKDEGVRTAMD